MRIDGASAKSFLLRILFWVTAAIGIAGYFCIRWLFGA